MKTKYFIDYSKKYGLDLLEKPWDLRIFPTEREFTEEGIIIKDNLSVLLDFHDVETVLLTDLNQSQFEEFMEYAPINLKSLQLFKCKDIHDFSSLEKLNNIEYLDFYWNRKATKLWNLNCNSKLKTLKMLDCNKVVDFTALKQSTIKDLILLGCNYLGSFTSKLVVNDLSKIFDMSYLESLTLDIVKNYDVILFLKSLAKLKNLKYLSLPDNSLSFEQFAWLKAKLPNTEGLDGVNYFTFTINGVKEEYYDVIGKRKPKFLTFEKMDKINKFKLDYELLVEKYENETEPPIESK